MTHLQTLIHNRHGCLIHYKHWKPLVRQYRAKAEKLTGIRQHAALRDLVTALDWLRLWRNEHRKYTKRILAHQKTLIEEERKAA